ncbi:MAG TPA: threonine/serine dehydratase [Blastocatellia bacterium]|nr:threonine/serine dehydratase [Blastocatellia bacterium]
MSQASGSARPLREIIRPTTIIDAPRLSRKLGVNLSIATETFQLTGSFKLRAAYNVAARVPNRSIITASSGNFGQAMAFACSLLGKSCTIVMPQSSAKVKIDAVREYGGEVDLIDVRQTTRAARVAELAAGHPEAYIASAYDDPLVIEGNSSLGEELTGIRPSYDIIVAPIGGGGLTSGIVTAVANAGQSTRVIAAEPLLGNDAARSLRAGHIVSNESEPQTVADGARTVSVGVHNWAVLQRGLSAIVEVPDENIKEGLRQLFSLANLKAEPTGALGIGALLTQPEIFHGASVCCVVSGGNVDPQVYQAILTGGL